MTKNIQYIAYYDWNDRIETGAVKFGNDWAGLFIRGDDCIRMMQALEYILSKVNPDLNSLEFKVYKSYLNMLIEEIETNVLSKPSEEENTKTHNNETEKLQKKIQELSGAVACLMAHLRHRFDEYEDGTWLDKYKELIDEL